ncbi:unnamed protein product [Brassica rapa]|uniref:Uncharacterized protein n=1 Tax=Brassica campestris TaxID=3711 RepID=A0A8D9H859_BRACM|nr:unnamed protein product [Brassica rapa]
MTIDRQLPVSIDRRAPLTHRGQMPKIDVARLNAFRPQPKPSDKPPEAIKTPSDDAADPMEIDWAYFTHRLWMFFRETIETEEDIGRMFCEPREKMKKRITLKKKSDPEQFAIPCTMKGIDFPHALCDTARASRCSGGVVRDLEVQIGNALVPDDFNVLDIKLNWNSSLLLGRSFLSTVEAVCNMQTNQLCLTLIEPLVLYNPIAVKATDVLRKN